MNHDDRLVPANSSAVNLAERLFPGADEDILTSRLMSILTFKYKQ